MMSVFDLIHKFIAQHREDVFPLAILLLLLSAVRKIINTKTMHFSLRVKIESMYFQGVLSLEVGRSIDNKE